MLKFKKMKKYQFDHFIILDGPDGIKFDSLQTDLVIEKEGATVGPYQCIVDCNPPCEIAWKRRNSSGHIDVISNKSDMPRQQLKKDMTSLICEVKWNSQTPKQKTIKLNVQCKYAHSCYKL